MEVYCYKAGMICAMKRQLRQVGRHTGRHVNEGESRDEREAALFALGLSEEARGCLFADSQSG